MSNHGGAPRHREWKIGCKVYIGNLAEGASKADIEGAFGKYGPLRNVWVARNPPGFAFVEFEDGRDAEDACRHLDGTRIAGGRIKAEMSHGRTRRGRGGGPPSFRGGGPPYSPPGGGYGSGSDRGSFHQSRGHYNGGDYPYHHGVSRGGHHGSHGHMDRPLRDRHVQRPRSPLGIKEFRHHSRSRSNSLGKSPPPPQRTARPRTPPSRSMTPERYL